MMNRKKNNKNVKPISGIIGKVIHSLGLSQNYYGWSVVNNWPEIVGKEINEHARAFEFKEGELVVAVEDSSWRQQLSMQLEEILDKIHSYPYGRAVKSIRLVHGMKGN